MSSLAEQYVNLFTNPSFETAGTPVTLATNLLTNPSMETAGAAATVRTNYVPNPNLETNATGWVGLSNATISRDTTVAHSGTASLKVVTPGAVAQEGGGIVVSQSFVNSQVSTGVWVLAPAGAQMISMIRAGSAVNDAITAFTGTGAWQFVTATHAAFSDMTSAQLLIRTSTAAAVTFWVDDAIMEAAGFCAGSFDGSTAASGDFTYAWLGTANASVSVQQGLTVVNASVPSSTNGGGIQSSQWSKSGSKSLRCLTVQQNYTGFCDIYPITVTPGATYTIVITGWMPTPQTGAGVNSQTARAIGARFPQGTESFVGPQLANIAGEQTLYYTFTVPASRTTMNLRLYQGPQNAVGDVWWDNAALIQGTYTGAAFNGDTPTDDYLTYQWTGAENASTSVELGTTAAAVTGGYQSSVWASQGTYSLFVPAGQTATVPVAGLSTVMVTPQTAGQTVTFDSTPVTSTSGNPITATASSEVTFGPGYWDCLAILAPGYEGTYFDGSTPAATTVDGITTYAWNGAVGASTSTMSILRYYTSNFNGLTWGPGTDIGVVEIDGLRSMKTRTSDESYPEDDGALPGIDLLAERTITYKLMIAAPQTMTVEQALEACAAAFQVIRDPAGGLPLQVFLPGWVEPRQLTARPVNNDVPIDVNYSLQYLQFSVQFDCADPLVYSSTQHTASTGLPSPTAGLPFNVTFPATFGSSAGGSVLVSNAGNYASRPVITITGPCINPLVSNGTDFMQFDLQLAATDVLVIDMAAKSVTLNGSASRYNTVTTGSSWWSLAPGTTTVTFESGDGAQVAATMTIQWRDAWGMM